MAGYNKIEYYKLAGIICGWLICSIIMAIAIFSLLCPIAPVGVSKTFTALLSFIFAVFCSGLIPGGITGTIIQAKHVIKWYHNPYSYDYTRYYVLKCIIWAIISFIFFVIGIGLTIGACYIIWNNYFHVQL